MKPTSNTNFPLLITINRIINELPGDREEAVCVMWIITPSKSIPSFWVLFSNLVRPHWTHPPSPLLGHVARCFFKWSPSLQIFPHRFDGPQLLSLLQVFMVGGDDWRIEFPSTICPFILVSVRHTRIQKTSHRCRYYAHYALIDALYYFYFSHHLLFTICVKNSCWILVQSSTPFFPIISQYFNKIQGSLLKSIRLFHSICSEQYLLVYYPTTIE